MNTADSRVELIWDAANSVVLSPRQRERLLDRLSGRLVDGVLMITASEHRAQLRNRETARERFVALVGEALGPSVRPRRSTKPTNRSKERRLQAKQRRTVIKSLRKRPRGD